MAETNNKFERKAELCSLTNKNCNKLYMIMHSFKLAIPLPFHPQHYLSFRLLW